MNIKRLVFWIVFLIVLVLIIWGLFVAMNKPASNGLPNVGAPAPITAVDHVEGSADAKVTLIEYGDFQCPACAEMAPFVERLAAEEATGTLRIVFRHFPLDEILSDGTVQHPNADAAAYASEAAGNQGKFWDMYKLLYQNQTEWAEVKDPSSIFESYAQSLGLDVTKFKTDAADQSVKQFVASEQAEGRTLGIDYTPTFFVNGKIITNPQGYEAFKAIIDSAAR
jgi:protein-disulfide isomerase